MNPEIDLQKPTIYDKTLQEKFLDFKFKSNNILDNNIFRFIAGIIKTNI